MAVLVAVCSFWYQDAAMRPRWSGLAGVAYAIVGLLFANRPDRARAFAAPQMLAVPPRPPDLPAVRPRWWALALPVGVVAAAMVLSATLMAAGQAERSRIPQVSLLLAVGLALLGVGVAATARAAGDRRALRRLFSTPVPVRSMQLVFEGADTVGVLDGPEGAWIPVQRAERPASFGRARIYGDPVVGGWFASEVDGHVRVPIGPARRPRGGGLAEVVDADGRDPDAGQEIERVPDHLLVEADRAAAPATLRTHSRLTRSAGLLQLGFVLLLPVTLVRAVVYVPWWVVAGVMVAVLAVLLEVGWRRGLIGVRARWNEGGFVVAEGARPPVRLPWSAVTRVSRFGQFVMVQTDNDTWLMRGHLWFGRDRDELWAALTSTWRRSTTHGSAMEPPSADSGRRPAGMFALVLLSATVLFGGFSSWVQARS